MESLENNTKKKINSPEKSLLQILKEEKFKKPPPLRRQKAFDNNLYNLSNINIIEITKILNNN